MLHWVLSWTGSARALPVSRDAHVWLVARVLWQEKTPRLVWHSVTSKSNFLVSSVTENLVGTESAQLTLVPPNIYKHSELVQ